MKLINQFFILILIGAFATGCGGQNNSKESNIPNDISLYDRYPEIPENLKKQDRIAKQIYSLQREVRDLKIEEFINDVKHSCEIPANIKVEFILDQESGELVQYLVDDKKNEIDCIQERLTKIRRKFGKMSYGFNNAFRMRPTSKFTIMSSDVKK